MVSLEPEYEAARVVLALQRASETVIADLRSTAKSIQPAPASPVVSARSPDAGTRADSDVDVLAAAWMPLGGLRSPGTTGSASGRRRRPASLAIRSTSSSSHGTSCATSSSDGRACGGSVLDEGILLGGEPL